MMKDKPIKELTKCEMINYIQSIGTNLSSRQLWSRNVNIIRKLYRNAKLTGGQR